MLVARCFTRCMSIHLRKVTRTKAGWNRACADGLEEYRAAVRAAREAGHTMPEIGQAAGITRQAVLYLLRDDPRKEQT